jgi:hypothetical protein
MWAALTRLLAEVADGTFIEGNGCNHKRRSRCHFHTFLQYFDGRSKSIRSGMGFVRWHQKDSTSSRRLQENVFPCLVPPLLTNSEYSEHPVGDNSLEVLLVPDGLL